MDFKKMALVAGLAAVAVGSSQRIVATAQAGEPEANNKKLAYNEVVKDFNNTFYHFATHALKEKVSGPWIVPGFTWVENGTFVEFQGFFGREYLSTISFTIYDRKYEVWHSDEKLKERVQVLKCSAFLATKEKDYQVECDHAVVAGGDGYLHPITLTGKTLAGNLQEFKTHFAEELQTFSQDDYENKVFIEPASEPEQ